jgi:hypothetical protein
VLDCSTQRRYLRLVFVLLAFQGAQSGADDFAGILVAPGIDPAGMN